MKKALSPLSAEPLAPFDHLDHRYRGENPVRTLGHLFHPDRGRLALAVAIFVVKHSPIWLLPLITATVLDVVVQHGPESGIWKASGVLLFILVINYPLHQWYVRCLAGSIRRMGITLRSALCRRMQQLSIGYHSRVSSSVLQAKVVRDVEAVEQMVQQSSDMGLGAVVTLIGGLVVIGVRVPEFLPVFLVVVPASGFLVMKLRGRLRSHNESFRREVEQLSSRVGEMTTLIPITRAHGLERTALGRVDGSLRQVFAAGMRLDTINGRFASLAWVILNTLGVLCLTGSALVAYHGWMAITPGDVVMLSSFFTVLTGSVTTLLGLAPILTKGLESVRSAGEVLQAPDLENNAGKARVESVVGRIDFEGVGFAYEEDGKSAVDGFTLSARPGRPSHSSARPVPASPRSSICSSDSSGPPRAASCWTGPTWPGSISGPIAASCRWCPRSRSSSRAASVTTSPTAWATRTRRRSCEPSGTPTRSNSWTVCRVAWTRSSGSTAHNCRAVRSSASPSRGH